MSNTPVFDALFNKQPFTAPVKLEAGLSNTPEAARKQGALSGAESMREAVLKLARATPKPTKQLQQLIAEIESIEHE